MSPALAPPPPDSEDRKQSSAVRAVQEFRRVFGVKVWG